ncbi:DUF2273 domain-containing protein [Paenibacillus allorhizosphaerae]|uniref:DUF2273 domain-containing protein n=1 Tax=Paenibacillus allorhizosphaerae TaxID=2849866 RepID=A0ABN7TK28_9BACL|nr:DUF2273 domain-containing protein [Paenibacillus allorhizosphaerae]CAG7642205.1 hypothetical protein PAECIP111802_02828 [Paenibacillus allorhizosphaerae]
MWKRMLEQLWEGHPRKTAGLGIGAVLGIIYLFFGFWHMLIFALIVYTGYYIGKRLDRGEPAFPVEDIWRQLMDKWRLFR